MYNKDVRPSGAKMSYHLLETNRICAANLDESNFHIFYALLLDSPNDLLKNMCLDPQIRYNVMIKVYDQLKFKFLTFITCFL